MSAPSSPVQPERSASRTSSSRGSGSDNVHHQQPSSSYAGTNRIHSSMSDNADSRYADKRYCDTRRDFVHGERSRVDNEYSNYAYVRASAVNHPQMKDDVVDYRTGDSRHAGVTLEGVYGHSLWPGHWAERSQKPAGHHPTDASLYNIASNRTLSYASSDDLPSTVPVTAAATASRFLDPASRWPTKHGSLDAGYPRPNGDGLNANISGGFPYHGSSQYTGSEMSLPDRSYDAVPRRLASPPVYYETPPHLRAAAANTSCDSVELSPADTSAVVLRGQNYVEVSKPFEMADVLKYSARLRRGAGDGAGELRSTSSPHLTAHTRELQYRDQRPSNPQYLPSRHYQKPVFDWALRCGFLDLGCNIIRGHSFPSHCVCCKLCWLYAIISS